METVRFAPAGDSALAVIFGQEISPQVNRHVQLLDAALQQHPIDGVIEAIPTYGTLTICFNPEKIAFRTLLRRVKTLLNAPAAAAAARCEVLEIPVLYGADMGPDLDFVAAHAKMIPQEVIRRHADAVYRVYMLGFLPGFAYLGGLDPSLHTPRLATPRTLIPEGSVGIAGGQTGVYPVASPGGWQLIGRTPVKLYDPSKAVPILLNAGDYLRFCPVDRAAFDQIAALVAAGRWECRRTPYEGETV